MNDHHLRLVGACAVGLGLIVGVGDTASAEVYRVKVKFPWLVGTGAPANAPTLPDEIYLVDCPQSPVGRDLTWIERTCHRVQGVYFNPKEYTITKSVPWGTRKPSG